jgi:hypothetical protein
VKTFNSLQGIAVAIAILGYVVSAILILTGLGSAQEEADTLQILYGFVGAITATITLYLLLSIGEIGKQLVYLNQKMSEEEEPAEKKEQDRKEET